MIREAVYEDLDGMLELYLHLHETSIPEHDDNLARVWDKMISDDDYHIIVNVIDGKIVSSCSCLDKKGLVHFVGKDELKGLSWNKKIKLF